MSKQSKAERKQKKATAYEAIGAGRAPKNAGQKATIAPVKPIPWGLSSEPHLL